jgi:ubiquinone/menaquinone biosynthesis C-methylase UbiE
VLSEVGEGIFNIKHACKLDTGMFALPMAELVGSKGRVYAIDNSEQMLAHIKSKNPPANLILVNSDVRRTGLSNQIADMCLLAFILHEVKEPSGVIAEASRLLKSDGRLIIIEWKADFDSPGPPRKRRISKEQIEQFFGHTGVMLDNYIDWSLNHYVVSGSRKLAAGGF